MNEVYKKAYEIFIDELLVEPSIGINKRNYLEEVFSYDEFIKNKELSGFKKFTDIAIIKLRKDKLQSLQLCSKSEI